MRDWKTICDVWASDGYSALTADERTFFNARVLIDSIENGGVISYFYNSGADTAADCVRALEELDAHGFKAEFERVIALFPVDMLRDIDDRNRIIDAWDDTETGIDDLLEEVDARLLELTPDLEAKLASFHGRSSV